MNQPQTRSTPTIIAYFMQHMCNMCVSAAGRAFFQSNCVRAPPQHYTPVKKKRRRETKKKTKQCTVVCTMIRIFLLITLLQSCHRLFPILCNNCATVRLSGLEEGPRRLNQIFSLMSRISWLLCFAFLASQVQSP